LIWRFLRQHQISWTDAFGFRGPRLFRAVLLGAVLAIVIVPVASELQVLSTLILAKFHIEPTTQTAVKMLEDASSVWLQIYLGVFAVIIAPVAEEFVFR